MLILYNIPRKICINMLMYDVIKRIVVKPWRFRLLYPIASIITLINLVTHYVALILIYWNNTVNFFYIKHAEYVPFTVFYYYLWLHYCEKLTVMKYASSTYYLIIKKLIQIFLKIFLAQTHQIPNQIIWSEAG